MVSAYGFPGVREGWSKNSPLFHAQRRYIGEVKNFIFIFILGCQAGAPQSQICILNMLMTLVCNRLIRDGPGTRVGSGEMVRWFDGLGTKGWPISQVVLRSVEDPKEVSSRKGRLVGPAASRSRVRVLCCSAG